jgi:hypothetical protein
MNLQYVPLLQIQRELHDIPRGMERFKQYLRTVGARDSDHLELPSLLIMNPMGKEHMTALLDALLKLDADVVAEEATAEASAQLENEPGESKVGLVVADDLMGGWTNRYASEFSLRFPKVSTAARKGRLPRWLRHYWITAVQWSSEAPTQKSVREANLTAVYRIAYMQQHDYPKTVREMLAQEGAVLARAGCTTPHLDPEDIAYTREVLKPFLDADDQRTAIECLFGDAAGRTLGFTPRGLSPWAGLALALHDETSKVSNSSESEKVL